MAKVYVAKEQSDHIYVKNTSGRDLQSGEFAVLGSLCGVVDMAAKNNEKVSLHIEAFIEIQVGADDLNAGANSYETGRALYYNDSIGKFADAAGAGFVKVGQIAESNQANGYISFYKYPAAQ